MEAHSAEQEPKAEDEQGRIIEQKPKLSILGSKLIHIDLVRMLQSADIIP
jgi:hypothetical protein